LKQLLRQKYLSIRQKLSLERRQTAAERLQEKILSIAPIYDRIASFASFNGEIDTFPFNKFFAEQNRLLLPRRERDTLHFYQVRKIFRSDVLFEPDPLDCEHSLLTQKDLLLVPAIAFDDDHFRLGYGKGYYDRLLQNHPDVSTFGVGFVEQLSKDFLPREPWDLPVFELFLF